MTAADLDVLVAASMKEIPSDEEISGDDDDPDLLVIYFTILINLLVFCFMFNFKLVFRTRISFSLVGIYILFSWYFVV